MIEIIEKTQEFTSASDNSVLEAAGKIPARLDCDTKDQSHRREVMGRLQMVLHTKTKCKYID